MDGWLGSALTAVAVVALCLLLFTEALSELFIYRRNQVIAGEYWRLVSGHFVHSTVTHMLLNFASWGVVCAYGVAVCSYRTWGVLLLCCALGTGGSLFFFQVDLFWYTGFSGVLHGLFVAVALLRLMSNRCDYSAWFILALILIKLTYEHFQGQVELSASFVGVSVISEAHGYGALSGALIGILLMVLRRRRLSTTACGG